MSLTFTYDEEADAAYLVIADRVSVDTVKAAESIFLDFDKDGALVGIEVLHVSATAPDLARNERSAIAAE